MHHDDVAAQCLGVVGNIRKTVKLLNIRQNYIFTTSEIKILVTGRSFHRCDLEPRGLFQLEVQIFACRALVESSFGFITQKQIDDFAELLARLQFGCILTNGQNDSEEALKRILNSHRYMRYVQQCRENMRHNVFNLMKDTCLVKIYLRLTRPEPSLERCSNCYDDLVR